MGNHTACQMGPLSVTLNDLEGRFNYVKPLKLEFGIVPNVMVALPNIGGALCSTPQSLADTHY